ncbi:MAG: DUF58 domain-containing protein, partial [Pirellulaceae bacterium]
TDGIEKSVPPRKGSRHVLRLIRELLFCQPMGSGTNLRRALEHLNRTAKRRTVVFLISDFLDKGFDSSLRVASRRHDIIPIVISDQREAEMPNVGLIRLRDEETGEVVTFDTSSWMSRRQYARTWEEQTAARDEMFRRLKLKPIHLKTGQDITEPLQQYFRQRERQG